MDALSRIPWDGDGNLTIMDPVTIQAIIPSGVQNCCLIPENCNTGLLVHSDQVQVGEAKISNDDLKIEQDHDNDIGPVFKLVKEKKHLQYICRTADSSGMQVLLKFRNDLLLKNGLLYRKSQLKGHAEPVNQFSLISIRKEQTLRTCHDYFGHLGMEQTLGLL